jgi:vacuolar iron transporter family protein
MKESIKRGFGFGITSGIITTLGLMIGLYAATNSRLAVLGGIITIAVADSLSDALGIHVSEEYAGKKHKEVWASTFSTFAFKFSTAAIFIIALFIFELKEAILMNIRLGIILLAISSFIVAKNRKEKVLKTFLEHLGIAIVVLLATYFLGNWISTWGTI